MSKTALKTLVASLLVLTLVPALAWAAQSAAQALAQDLHSLKGLLAQLDKKVGEADKPSPAMKQAQAKPEPQPLKEPPAPAEPEDDGLKIDFTVPYFSKYISRGLLTVDDPVLQPGFTLVYKGFTFNVWGNYNPTDKIGRKNKFTEVDVTAEYALEIGDLTIPLGVTHYLYPNTTQPNTTEVYAGLSYKWFITPALKVYQDVGDVRGTYATLGLSKEIELARPAKDWSVGLTPLLQAGWGSAAFNKYRYNWGVDADHFTDLLLALTLPIKYGEMLTISPGFYHVWLLDSEIKDAAGFQSKSFFGLTLTFSF